MSGSGLTAGTTGAPPRRWRPRRPHRPRPSAPTRGRRSWCTAPSSATPTSRRSAGVWRRAGCAVHGRSLRTGSWRCRSLTRRCCRDQTLPPRQRWAQRTLPFSLPHGPLMRGKELNERSSFRWSGDGPNVLRKNFITLFWSLNFCLLTNEPDPLFISGKSLLR